MKGDDEGFGRTLAAHQHVVPEISAASMSCARQQLAGFVVVGVTLVSHTTYMKRLFCVPFQVANAKRTVLALESSGLKVIPNAAQLSWIATRSVMKVAGTAAAAPWLSTAPVASVMKIRGSSVPVGNAMVESAPVVSDL